MLRSLLLACLLVPGSTLAAADWQLWTTTTMGSGADATVQNEQGNDGSAATIAVRNNQFPSHYQKALLRFDLRKMEKAEGAKLAGRTLIPNLVLNLANKADADHTINVFGLIERKSYGGTKDKPILGADWSEKEITYANMPAFSNYGGGKYEEGKEKWEKGMLGGVNHECTALLGSISVKNDQEGEVVTPLPDLTAFVEKHAKSKVVTLILCRVTSTVNATSFHSKESAATAKIPKLAFGF